jgi:hypothetical protein
MWTPACAGVTTAAILISSGGRQAHAHFVKRTGLLPTYREMQVTPHLSRDG